MRFRPTLRAIALLFPLVGSACTAAERGGPSVPLVPPIRTAEAESLAALAGRQWVLREWRAGERAAVKPAVTLTYTEGRFAGRAGCNRFTANAKPGATAGALTIGPIGTTRMICPEPVMEIESRFLTAFGRVKHWALMPSGDLAVTYPGERGDATLVFSEVTTVRSD